MKEAIKMNRIGNEMFKLQEVINKLKMKVGNEEIELFYLLPICYTKNKDWFYLSTFSYYPIKYIKDEKNEKDNAVIGLSSIPLSIYIERFLLNKIGNNYINILFEDKPTNIYMKVEGKYLQSIYLKRNGYYGYLGTIKDLILLLSEYNLDMNIVDFVTYKDLKWGSSNVILTYKTKYGWCGGSHRAFYHFKVGDKINLNKFTLLTSHGYVEGCEKYDKETREIEKIKSYANENGIIEIKDDEIAKNLAIRFAQATG